MIGNGHSLMGEGPNQNLLRAHIRKTARKRCYAWKSLRCLPYETGVSKWSAQTATKLLYKKLFKTAVMYELQSCDPANKGVFWYLDPKV
jgi:hypothetical protein